jgi:hypothetical protein
MPGISQAKLSTDVSPLKKHGGTGLVQLGEVSSLATWNSDEGRIEITFNTEHLSAERMRDLEHYRSSSRPVEVHLPGERQTVRCVVMGFDRSASAASFYLTKADKR